MKNKIKRISATCTSLVLVTIALITLSSSCKKSDTSPADANSSFIGIYYGTLGSGFYTEADTVTITAGSSSSDIVMNSKTGKGSTYTINGTVSSTALTIPSQQVNVGSTIYTVSGSGTLDSPLISIHYAFTSASNTTTNLTFNGKRN